MIENNFTRREFLIAAGLGMAAIARPSSGSTPGPLAQNQPFTFVQVCDTQLGFGGYEHDMATFKQTVDQINELKPDFVVICGDLVETPDAKSFADFNKIKAGFTMPCYCAMGNHDAGKKPSVASLEYFRKVVGQDYYAFEHKGCTFVSVNTQLWKIPIKGETEKLDAWLKTTLEAAVTKQTRIVVFGHHPLFIKKPDEKEQYVNLPCAKRAELLELFAARGVVAVLGGHLHRMLVNEYKGIQLVNAEATSKSLDRRPLGFRLWHIGDSRPFRHDFFPLAGVQT